jgi:hypothetical protein
MRVAADTQDSPRKGLNATSKASVAPRSSDPSTCWLSRRPASQDRGRFAARIQFRLLNPEQCRRNVQSPGQCADPNPQRCWSRSTQLLLGVELGVRKTRIAGIRRSRCRRKPSVGVPFARHSASRNPSCPQSAWQEQPVNPLDSNPELPVAARGSQLEARSFGLRLSHLPPEPIESAGQQ